MPRKYESCGQCRGGDDRDPPANPRRVVECNGESLAAGHVDRQRAQVTNFAGITAQPGAKQTLVINEHDIRIRPGGCRWMRWTNMVGHANLPHDCALP